MERILVIQTAFLGDAVLTLPAIQMLKKKYPDAVIDVVAIPASEAVFASSPSVNKVFVFDKKGRNKSIASTIGFALQLRKNKYSLLISPHRSFRTALITALTGPRESIAFTNSSLKFVYTHLVKYERRHHEVRRNLELFGFPCDEESWKILPVMQTPAAEKELNPEASGATNVFLKYAQAKIVAVAPGTVWETKRYPENYFRQILKYFAENQFVIILMGGASDKELCARLSSGMEKSVINMAGQLSVPESVEMLRRCLFIICNDSAPTHLAMAAGIPAITIYCSTVPDFGFYPYSKGSISLGVDGLKCKPCGIHGYNECPIGTFECALKLTPEMVIGKLINIIPM